MKLKVSKHVAVATVERSLLEKALGDMWSKMASEEREQFFEALSSGRDTNINGKALINGKTVFELIGSGLLSIGSAAGSVASILAEQLLGQALVFATQFGVASVVTSSVAAGSIVGGGVATGSLALSLFGPIGLMIAGIGITAACTSPAYRVTVPACIYIAALRQFKLGKTLG